MDWAGGRSARPWRLSRTEAADPAEARARERRRRLVLSALAAMAARAVSVLGSLVSIPLTFHYLGAERYGVWVEISALLVLLSFADLGIGAGVLTRVATAQGAGDVGEQRTIVSSAMAALAVVGLAALALFWIAYPLVDWGRAFSVRGPAAQREAALAVGVLATGLALSIPASLVQRVQMGLQEGYRASLWQALGGLLSLSGVVAATSARLGLPWLVGALVGGPLLAALANSALVFGRPASGIRLTWAAASWTEAKATLHLGGLFLVLQVVGAVVYGADPFIIAHRLGPDMVVQYAPVERLFSLVPMVLSFGLAPLWPAYGEALARGDEHWVRRTLVRSTALAVAGASLGCVIVGLAAPVIVGAWIGPAVVVTPLLLAALAAWKVVEAAGASAAFYLNGARVVRLQVVINLAFGALALALKLWLTPRLGVAGCALATALAYAAAILPAYAVFLRSTVLRR